MPIQTINSGSSQGYQVRVGPRHATLTKFFASRLHGGDVKALAKARKAERAMQKHAVPVESRSGPRSREPSNNTSGLVGIRPSYVVFSDTTYLYFAVSWSEGGRARCTSFSAEKHGLLVALQMAMDRREKGTGVKSGLTARQAWNRMKHLVAGHEG